MQILYMIFKLLKFVALSLKIINRYRGKSKKYIYGGTCVSILQWGKHNYMFYIYILFNETCKFKRGKLLCWKTSVYEYMSHLKKKNPIKYHCASNIITYFDESRIFRVIKSAVNVLKFSNIHSKHSDYGLNGAKENTGVWLGVTGTINKRNKKGWNKHKQLREKEKKDNQKTSNYAEMIKNYNMLKSKLKIKKKYWKKV